MLAIPRRRLPVRRRAMPAGPHRMSGVMVLSRTEGFEGREGSDAQGYVVSRPAAPGADRTRRRSAADASARSSGSCSGVSAGAYWALAVVAGIGAVLAGFEHQDGWGGADRGLVGGVLFAIGVLVAHAIAGTHAKVSLGGFPPLLIVIDAIFGMLLGALGGRIARGLRERHEPADEAPA